MASKKKLKARAKRYKEAFRTVSNEYSDVNAANEALAVEVERNDKRIVELRREMENSKSLKDRDEAARIKAGLVSISWLREHGTEEHARREPGQMAQLDLRILELKPGELAYEEFVSAMRPARRPAASLIPLVG